MTTVNVKEIMTQIPDHFNPQNAKGAAAKIQCLFTGDQASNWVIEIEDQTCQVSEGKVENPDLTIKADGEDGVNVLTGKLDAMRAYMLGKVKVSGDISLGMKLVKYFQR